MNEKKQFRDVLIKIVIICVCAALYSWGGAEFGHKTLRRFLMPLVMASGMYYFSRDWKCLFVAPLVGIGTSLGYGSDNIAIKILKRFYCGLVLGLGSSSFDWFNKRFIIAIFQTALVTISMIILGVWNILPDSRTEEFVIGFLIAFLPIMSSRQRI